MQDLINDTNPLSDFQRDAAGFLRQLKETGRPVVLTVDGKPEVVVQDAASYQKLLDLAERAERMDVLRASVTDMQAGRVTPADDMRAEMRRILGAEQG